MPSLQITFASDLETVTALSQHAGASHMTLQEYMRKLTRDHLATMTAASARQQAAAAMPEPAKTPTYTRKDYREYLGMKKRCEQWEVDAWLSYRPGFDPEAFAAKPARKRVKK